MLNSFAVLQFLRVPFVTFFLQTNRYTAISSYYSKVGSLFLLNPKHYTKMR